MLTGCSGSDPEQSAKPTQTSSSIAEEFRDPVQAATKWLAERLEDIDNTPTLMFLNFVGRNWQIPEIYPETLKIAEEREPAGLSLLLWRLVRTDFPSGQQFEEPADTQELLSAALYCDQLPLGPGFNKSVDSSINAGGYLASHAAFALQWVKERGCPLDGLQNRIDLAVAVVAGELEQADVIGDLQLEQAAALAYLGSTDMIPADFGDAVAKAQNPDGGWAINRPGQPSNWHPTIFGLWTLLALNNGPGVGATMVNPKA